MNALCRCVLNGRRGREVRFLRESVGDGELSNGAREGACFPLACLFLTSGTGKVATGTVGGRKLAIKGREKIKRTRGRIKTVEQ